MTDKIGGSCLCGSVQFETTRHPAAQVLCHCTDCQTVSGSAYYTAYIVPLDQLELISGEPGAYAVQSDRGRSNTRKFCRDCGCRLWAELESGVASVNGMALEDKSHFNPTHNHRLVTAPDWCAVNASLDELPVS